MNCPNCGEPFEFDEEGIMITCCQDSYLNRTDEDEFFE